MEINKTNNLLRRSFAKTDFKRQVEKATGKNGWIIGYLAEHQGEDIFQKDIETTFSLRRSTVSSMVKLMEKKGYVRRESVEHDARLKKLVLTEKALDAHQLMLEEIKENEQKLRRNISEHELDVFFSVLEKIRNNIDEEE